MNKIKLAIYKTYLFLGIAILILWLYVAIKLSHNKIFNEHWPNLYDVEGSDLYVLSVSLFKIYILTGLILYSIDSLQMLFTRNKYASYKEEQKIFIITILLAIALLFDVFELEFWRETFLILIISNTLTYYKIKVFRRFLARYTNEASKERILFLNTERINLVQHFLNSLRKKYNLLSYQMNKIKLALYKTYLFLGKAILILWLFVAIMLGNRFDEWKGLYSGDDESGLYIISAFLLLVYLLAGMILYSVDSLQMLFTRYKYASFKEEQKIFIIAILLAVGLIFGVVINFIELHFGIFLVLIISNMITYYKVKVFRRFLIK